MKFIATAFIAVWVLVNFSACRKQATCPAYNSVHTNKNYGYNPNNAKRAKEDNKKDIEKRKDAELNAKPPKRSNAYSLFPKGVR